MSEPTRERLYELLPAIYRIRDAAQGQPLRALLAVMEAEAQRIRDDIDGLHQNWFIETCEEWAVPYIAELLGIRRLPAVGGPGFNQRTHIASTLSYRRRKGTHALFADLARDVTGWPVRAVEMFRLVGTTQHLTVPRPGNLRTPDLRDRQTLGKLGTPFDPIARTADVRSIAEGVIRQNLPNVAVFVWRLETFRINDAPAGTVDASGASKGQYTFSVLGDDIPLFNPGRLAGGSGVEADLPVLLIDELTEERRELRRRALNGDIEARRRAFEISFVPAGKSEADRLTVNPEDVFIADLASFSVPPGSKAHVVAVDPLLGRMLFATPPAPNTVRVSYSYGFSGPVGAGPYDIADRTPLDPKRDKTVSAEGFVLPAEIELPAGLPPMTLEVQGSGRFTAPSQIRVPKNAQFEVRAQNGQRPFMQIGNTGSVAKLDDNSSVILDGLLAAGGQVEIEVLNDKKASVTLRRCTLVPDKTTPAPSIRVSGGGTLDLTLEQCIVGGLSRQSGSVSLTVRDSIVDGPIDATTATIERCTVFGPVNADTLELASDTIFMAKVEAKFAQRGCVRFSFVADGSVTPPRFRCQPDLALSAMGPGDVREHILKRVTPLFTSTPLGFRATYGPPGYGQLRRDCDEQIRRGASDGGEMGAMQFLHILQREENLRAAIDEYLRFGYEAGIFYVT